MCVLTFQLTGISINSLFIGLLGREPREYNYAGELLFGQ